MVFCTSEIGALPFKIAKTLNDYGVQTYYISLSGKQKGHDSTRFHFGNGFEDWDLSHIFSDVSCFTHKLDQVFYLAGRIISRLRRIKEQYQITHCFATGIKSYLLKQAGIDYKYWSYGSDLDRHCFHPVFPYSYPFWIKGLLYIPFRLVIRPNARNSISSSESIQISPYQVRNLRKVCANKNLFFLPHLIEVRDYDTLVLEKAKSREKVCKEIGAKHFFFSSARHEWAGSFKDEPDLKGNDILLKAFQVYLSKAGAYDTKLILVEKGTDMNASKSLAKKLKIDKNIFWVKEMRRDEIQKFYQGANMCLGQFGTPVITYAALEPLANGNICASFYGNNSNKVPFYDTMPPILNSRNPDEIAKFMHESTDNKSFYENLCHKSWKWVRVHCSEERFVRSFLKVFEIN
jgi:hypothetical protein